MRLIDADEIKKTHYLYFVEDKIDADMVTFVKKIVADVLDHAPTVDAIPVAHGKWVFNENDDMFYCTNCKNGSVRNDYPYCHWCGAVMDGEKVTE